MAEAVIGLTLEQDQALFTRDVPVALSAGAGCGKTFVLTERFLSHLEDIDADELGRLVAITFTDRAAREMRDRIRRGCHRRILQAPTDLEAERWLRIYRELDAAKISTIHALCSSLLRAHAVEAELDPRFQTLDAGEAGALARAFVDDQLRLRLSEHDAATMDLIVRYGLDPFRAMIFRLMDCRHLIDIAAWSQVTPEQLVARWERHYHEFYLPRVGTVLAGTTAVKRLYRLCENLVGLMRHATMLDRMRNLLELLPKLPETRDARKLQTLLEGINEHARIEGVTVKHWPDADAHAAFKEIASKVRELVKPHRERGAFDGEAALPAARYGLLALQVAWPIIEGYQRHKQQQSVLDFDDLLIRARDLLRDPRQRGLRQRLADQIHAVLVDECQDTDPLQESLIRDLLGGDHVDPRLFFVGDFKQSIYRFRNADPRVFRAMRERVPATGRLPLTLNFRSQPGILQFVNGLFGEALGTEYEALRAHRPALGGQPNVEFLWIPCEEGEDDSAEGLRRKEAEWLARRLRGMFDGKECLVEDEAAAEEGRASARPVEPRDVAILFRALTNASLYEEALRRYGIDYYLVGGRAFYSQQEVFDLLNLLRSLDCPSDTVSLAGALRSPFFSLDDEALFWLSEHEQGLAAGLFAEEPCRDLTDEQRRRVEFAKETLEALRAQKDRLPIAELIRLALDRTGYDAALLGEFLGERKLANLQKLVGMARDFDRTGIFTLADFITQLGSSVAERPKEALAATLPETANVVRLMSIHQSKGLEFPVVILPDLARHKRGDSTEIYFAPDLGPLVKDPDSDALTGHTLHRQREELEDEAERLRLFYVATTRAADYLILSAGLKSLVDPPGSWLELLADRFDLATGEFLAEAPADCDAPGPIRVSLQEPVCQAPAPLEHGKRLSEVVEQAQVFTPQPEGLVTLLAAPKIDGHARRQFSFSRLSGALEPARTIEDDTVVDTLIEPAQANAAIDPLALGSLVHRALELARFDQGPGQARELVTRLAQQQWLASPETSALAVDMVERFFHSRAAQQMARARAIHRELEFLLDWPAEDHGPRRYLSGTMDCLYQDEAGNWRLVDYKTNLVDSGSLDKLRAKYEMQMVVYAWAVERTWGRPPVSCTLHLLRTGQELEYTLTEEASRRVQRQVDEAIKKLQERANLGR